MATRRLRAATVVVLLGTAMALTTAGSASATGFPVAVDDAYTSESGELLGVPAPGPLGNDQNVPPGDVFVPVTSFSHAAEAGTNPNGSFYYRSEPGFVGLDSMTYCIEPPPGHSIGCTSNFATVHITVAPSTRVNTTTTLVSSPNPSYVDQPVTFTATVSKSGGGAPTGSVQFTTGLTTLGTVPLDGTGHARLVTSALPSGVQEVDARYSGADRASGDFVHQTVLPASSTPPPRTMGSTGRGSVSQPNPSGSTVGTGPGTVGTAAPAPQASPATTAPLATPLTVPADNELPHRQTPLPVEGIVAVLLAGAAANALVGLRRHRLTSRQR